MQLIVEVDTGTDEDLYKFTHNMIREVIYNDLSRAKRRLMHKKVAEVLEKERGEVIDQVIYQLAYHYQMANDIDNAIRYNIKAGNKAMTSFALEEALTYFSSALNLIETADDPDKFKDREIMLLNNLGNIHHVTGDWRQALKFLGDATKLCEKDSLEMARSLRALGNVEMFRTEWNGAIKNFKRALEISEKLQDHYGMADAFSGLAWISWKTGDSEKTIVYGKKCIEHAKKIGNNAMIAKALMDIGNSYNEHLNNYDKALEYYQSALEILTKEPRKDIRQMARAMNNIGDVYMNRGEYDKAIGYFTKTLEYADKIGEARMKGFGKANIAECYLKMKEYEKAKPFLAEARTMFERLDDRYMLAQTIMYHGVMYAGLKQWDKVDEHFTTALKIQQEHNIPFGVAITLYEYGVALKERGDRERARQNLEQAKALFRQLGAQTNLEIADMELESL